MVGKVLDHLRAEAGLPAVIGGGPTVARAVADYEATALALGAPGTRASYRTWTRRLVAQASLGATRLGGWQVWARLPWRHP